ncbi:hypothetical protein N7522_006456 [Penicillium canescens]|nr:hypothetical protein N7522_006456 [Penicillium canescens]
MSNVQPRAYQLEMFDMSMKNNIIAVRKNLYVRNTLLAIKWPENDVLVELACELWRNWNAARNIR